MEWTQELVEMRFKVPKYKRQKLTKEQTRALNQYLQQQLPLYQIPNSEEGINAHLAATKGTTDNPIPESLKTIEERIAWVKENQHQLAPPSEWIGEAPAIGILYFRFLNWQDDRYRHGTDLTDHTAAHILDNEYWNQTPEEL